jgi:hypothetical protein
MNIVYGPRGLPFHRGTVNLVELAAAETIDWLHRLVTQGVEGGWAGEHRWGQMRSAKLGQAGSLILVGQIAKVRSSKAARS